MTVGGVLNGQKPSPTSFPGGEVVDFSYIAQLADRYQANTSSLIPPPFPTTAGFRFAIREILGVRFHFIFILIDSSFSFKSFNQKRSGKASPSLPLLKNSPTSLVIFKYSTDRTQTITPIFGTNYCLCLRPVPPGKLKVVLLPMELECFNASMAPSGISLSSIDSFYLLPAHKIPFSEECVPQQCDPGYIIPQGEKICIPCGLGFYKSNVDSNECSKCIQIIPSNCDFTQTGHSTAQVPLSF